MNTECLIEMIHLWTFTQRPNTTLFLTAVNFESSAIRREQQRDKKTTGAAANRNHKFPQKLMITSNSTKHNHKLNAGRSGALQLIQQK